MLRLTATLSTTASILASSLVTQHQLASIKLHMFSVLPIQIAISCMHICELIQLRCWILSMGFPATSINLLLVAVIVTLTVTNCSAGEYSPC